MAVHLDYETSSRIDIKKFGGYRYACDPSTRILMFAIAGENGNTLLWDSKDPDSYESQRAFARYELAIDEGELIYAWNAGFEHAISRYQLEKQLGLLAPKLSNYRCVQAQAFRAALCPSLGQTAAVLGVEEQKGSKGTALIEVFSNENHISTLKAPAHVKVYDRSEKGRKAPNRKTRSPIHGWEEGTVDQIKEGLSTHHDEILWDWTVTVGGDDFTVREAWELFKEYCRQDVRTETDVQHRLHKFELTGYELASWQFNMRMNDRGIPVNIPALKTANRIVNQFIKRVSTRFRNITGLNHTQGEKFKDWLHERGYTKDNLQAATVAEYLDDCDDLLKPEALEALKLFKLVNFAALKKIPTMLGAACPDGRVRGTMQWHATRTGRAAGRIIQPQNAKKAVGILTSLAYQMICDGCTLEDIEELWSSPMDVIASCIRHFIQDPDGVSYDADYTGVEARIAPWAVDDTRKLDSILSGVDQYRDVAAAIYKRPYEDIGKPSKERDVGKRAELACQFGVGGEGLMLALWEHEKIRVNLKEGNRIVRVYRSMHPKTKEAWDEVFNAAIAAITHGKTTTVMGGRVRIAKVVTAGMKYLVIELPSGRRLYYPKPKKHRKWKAYKKEEMKDDPWKAERKGYWSEEIQFWGKIEDNFWGYVSTWGARLFENIVQAIGADLLHEGCISAEKMGFLIYMIVHDQALCPKHKTRTADEYCVELCKVGRWARDFPLEAEGGEVPYYRKD